MINTRFWSDTYISSIDPLEKLLFLYFITNQYTNICGIYEIPLKQIALDTGLDRDNLEKVFLPRLAQAKKVYYIDGWIYIKNFLKHQKASGNVQLGIENGMTEVPSDILAKIKLIEDTPPSQVGHSLKLKLESELKLEPKPKRSKMSEEDFTTFWNTYPRHDTKAKSKDKFLKLDKELLPTILSAIETHKKSDQWQKNNGQYIPQPLTWINQERWEDETKEAVPQTMEQIAQQMIKDIGDSEIAFNRFVTKYGMSEASKLLNIFNIF